MVQEAKNIVVWCHINTNLNKASSLRERRGQARNLSPIQNLRVRNICKHSDRSPPKDKRRDVRPTYYYHIGNIFVPQKMTATFEEESFVWRRRLPDSNAPRIPFDPCLP